VYEPYGVIGRSSVNAAARQYDEDGPAWRSNCVVLKTQNRAVAGDAARADLRETDCRRRAQRTQRRPRLDRPIPASRCAECPSPAAHRIQRSWRRRRVLTPVALELAGSRPTDLRGRRPENAVQIDLLSSVIAAGQGPCFHPPARSGRRLDDRERPGHRESAPQATAGSVVTGPVIAPSVRAIMGYIDIAKARNKPVVTRLQARGFEGGSSFSRPSRRVENASVSPGKFFVRY